MNLALTLKKFFSLCTILCAFKATAICVHPNSSFPEYPPGVVKIELPMTSQSPVSSELDLNAIKCPGAPITYLHELAISEEFRAETEKIKGKPDPLEFRVKCTATKVEKQKFLTAKHCVEHLLGEETEFEQARIGRMSWFNQEEQVVRVFKKVKITKISMHENRDIAFFEIDIDTSEISEAKLATKSEIIKSKQEDSILKVLYGGYGFNGYLDYSKPLYAEGIAILDTSLEMLAIGSYPDAANMVMPGDSGSAFWIKIENEYKIVAVAANISIEPNDEQGDGANEIWQGRAYLVETLNLD